jgi:hypothetical protein
MGVRGARNRQQPFIKRMRALVLPVAFLLPFLFHSEFVLGPIVWSKDPAGRSKGYSENCPISLHFREKWIEWQEMESGCTGELFLEQRDHFGLDFIPF